MGKSYADEFGKSALEAMRDKGIGPSDLARKIAVIFPDNPICRATISGVINQKRKYIIARVIHQMEKGIKSFK